MPDDVWLIARLPDALGLRLWMFFVWLTIVKIFNIYIMLSCTHLYHFFSVSIQYLQCIHCLLQQTFEIYYQYLLSLILPFVFFFLLFSLFFFLSFPVFLYTIRNVHNSDFLKKTHVKFIYFKIWNFKLPSFVTSFPSNGCNL